MIILRCDDFDPRITLDVLKPLHEEFIKHNVPMTIAVNNLMGHRIGFDEDVIQYVNNMTHWDIQLHGFEHDRYWSMPPHYVYRDIYANLMLTKRDFINSNPTILYPPWNESSKDLVDVCEKLGLEVRTENETLREFVEWNKRNKTDTYVWHWWNFDDRDIIPKALDKVIELSKQV